LKGGKKEIRKDGRRHFGGGNINRVLDKLQSNHAPRPPKRDKATGRGEKNQARVPGKSLRDPLQGEGGEMEFAKGKNGPDLSREDAIERDAGAHRGWGGKRVPGSRQGSGRDRIGEKSGPRRGGTGPDGGYIRAGGRGTREGESPRRGSEGGSSNFLAGRRGKKKPGVQKETKVPEERMTKRENERKGAKYVEKKKKKKEGENHGEGP